MSFTSGLKKKVNTSKKSSATSSPQVFTHPGLLVGGNLASLAPVEQLQPTDESKINNLMEIPDFKVYIEYLRQMPELLPYIVIDNIPTFLNLLQACRTEEEYKSTIMDFLQAASRADPKNPSTIWKYHSKQAENEKTLDNERYVITAQMEAVENTLFQCSKCGGCSVYRKQKQIRSADEGKTYTFICANKSCAHKWVQSG